MGSAVQRLKGQFSFLLQVYLIHEECSRYRKNANMNVHNGTDN